MYIVIHESRDSSRKYLVRYDIDSKQFFIDNEDHETMYINESTLYHLIDDYFKREFDD